MRRRPGRLSWRAFDSRESHAVDNQLQLGVIPSCPCCGERLETRPATRAGATLPDGARGFDVECSCCRRYLSRIADSPGSIYYMRVQRLAGAVLRA